MNKNELTNILQEEIDIYKINIAKELEKTHDKWFDNFGFPMFGTTSKDYHEQVYFQSYLESYTRKMINGILKRIADDESSDNIMWPEFEYIGIYNGYTNIECEEKFAFEIINKDKKIGYRYSFLAVDEIEKLLTEYKLDNIKIVMWQKEEEIMHFDYEEDCVEVINAFELFQELLYEMEEKEIREAYDLFVEEVMNAVEDVNSMISLTTVPGFTLSYLHKMRQEMVVELETQISELTSFVVRNDKYKKREEESQKLITEYKLDQKFLQKKMQYAFVGASQYAKSFMTSEYLYRYFEKNKLFDYTPIVCGYIKSIEQLLYDICKGYLYIKGEDEKISEMKSWTMNDYQGFIENNTDIICPELIDAKKKIIDCLDSYRVENRNRLFHRDYFNDWKRVELIRKNTFFLYMILLGIVKDDLIQKNPKLLSVLNEEYDRFFSIIDEDESHYYTFTINGEEYRKFEKESRKEALLFTWNGLIRNRITFKKLNYDSYEIIEISSKNIPSEVWSTDIYGNKTKLIWKLTQ